MKIVVGNAERETRRGSYWMVPIIARNEEGEPWADVIAMAHGATERAAWDRAHYIRDALEQYTEQLLRMEVGL